MSRYCLDTVAYSHFKRGESRIADLLDRAVWIGVPVVVLGELFAGFEQGSNKSKNLAQLDEFLSAPVVEVLPVDREQDLARRPRPDQSEGAQNAVASASPTRIIRANHFQGDPRMACLADPTGSDHAGGPRELDGS